MTSADKPFDTSLDLVEFKGVDPDLKELLATTHGGRPPTMRTLWWLVAPIMTFVRERGTRLDAIEQRLATIEARPQGLAYRGIWSDSTCYGKGDMTTHAGSVWCALDASVGRRPGQAGERFWQLAVKGTR